jgi:CBS domain-containing protein
MKVKDIMTTEPLCCAQEANLGTAAELMLRGDCGILPVLADGRIVGVVTDRDLFIALATRDARASELTVADVAQTPVFTCSPDADVSEVLETMKKQSVRRIPVEGLGGTVIGMVSMNDIVRAIGPRKVREAQVVNTLQSICARHQPAPRIAAA